MNVRGRPGSSFFAVGLLVAALGVAGVCAQGNAPPAGPGRLMVLRGQKERHVLTYNPRAHDRRFGFITWVQTNKAYSDREKAVTLGGAIHPRAVVSVPSAKVPVVISNTSNWYVHELSVGEPPAIVKKDKLIVYYHPDFSMTADVTHRLALIMIESDEAAQPLGLVPFKLVASPLLPEWETHRHDDYGLANCEMAAVNPNNGALLFVPMLVISCVHANTARAAYKDRVCAYTRSEEAQRGAMLTGGGDVLDVGSPLYCGSALVGVYAGVQNVHGDMYKHRSLGRQVESAVIAKTLEHDQQYVFEVPGAAGNHLFLRAFLEKEPAWTATLDLADTAECFDGHLAPKKPDMPMVYTTGTTEDDGGSDGTYTTAGGTYGATTEEGIAVTAPSRTGVRKKSSWKFGKKT